MADIASNTINIANNAIGISNNAAEIVSISNDVGIATRCTATNWDYSCCTSANPCGINQGDCDSNADCYGDLKCGTDNCIGFGDSGADCCMLVGIHDNALPSQCVNYESLTDSSRRFDFVDPAVQSDSSKAFCDKGNGVSSSRPTSNDWVGASWYRIEGGAGTQLSENGYDWVSGTNSGTCGTHVGSHMVGGHPNLAGATEIRSIYFGLSSSYHSYNHDIEVTNCNGFFVYNLIGMTGCSLRYCTQ